MRLIVRVYAVVQILYGVSFFFDDNFFGQYMLGGIEDLYSSIIVCGVGMCVIILISGELQRFREAFYFAFSSSAICILADFAKIPLVALWMQFLVSTMLVIVGVVLLIRPDN